jgi:protein TonB
MELKKSPKTNLENKRNIFFLVGFVISIAFCLYGFESNSSSNRAVTLGILSDRFIDEDLTPVIQLDEPKVKPDPLPKVVELLRIVDNSTEITDELNIVDTEVTPETAINALMQVSREPEKDVDESTIFISPEQMPEFPGGNLALLRFLNQNIKYPSVAVDNFISGKVTVSFVVNKDGSVSDAVILRGVDPALDKEAIRVVYSMPKWKPGLQGTKPVRVSFSVPINFVLK